MQFERPESPRGPGELEGKVHIADDFEEMPEDLAVALGITD